MLEPAPTPALQLASIGKASTTIADAEPPLLVQKPTLLVQPCNGTTAGMGYLEVNVICPCKSSHGWLVTVLSIPIGDDAIIHLLTLTLTTIAQ